MTRDIDTSSKRVMQSYLSYGDKSYMVSTAERASSAMLAPELRYNETIIWQFDYATGERGKMLHMDSDSVGSIDKHIFLCEQIHEGQAEHVFDRS